MADDGFKIPDGSAEPYAAGSNGRRFRTWRPSHAGPNTVIARSLSLIRARNRSAVRNDAWAGACADKTVSNMIGTGVQARSVNGDKDRKQREKAAWHRWARKSDADGVLDFYGQQAMIVREWHEAGEAFARIRRRRAADGLPVPLQIQCIEAEQVPAEYNADLPNGNRVRMGIEFDRLGRRVRYHMYREHPGDFALFARDLSLVPVSASEVLHIYEPTRAGQIRGVPDGTGALVRMFNLDNLEDAVLERQKIANLFAGWYVNQDEADRGGMIQDMAGDAEDADGTPLAGLEPGTMQELPPGMEPKFSDPPDAGNNYPDFLRSQLMAIAARHGVPYEVLTGDLRNVSDRALRLILNEFRRRIEQRQWLYLIPQFCQPVREAWWDAGVLAGALDAPGYADRRDEYIETLWVPHGWPYSHPVQDVDADTKAIEAGLTSRTEVILSNGDDPEEIDEEQAEDNRRADGLGLVYSSDGRQARNRSRANRNGRDGDEGTDEPAATTTKLPDLHVNIAPPAVNVGAPNITVHTPDIHTPPVNVNVEPPEVHVTTPDVHVTTPEINVHPPEVTMHMPKSITVEQPPLSAAEERFLNSLAPIDDK